MNAGRKFAFFLALGFLFSMMSVGHGQGTKQGLLPLSLNDSQVSSEAPIVVIGTLIDGTGARPVPDAVVVITNGFITAVGPRERIAIPRNARIFSFPLGTILPGFINAHVHTKYDEQQLQAWAREGITTVRDLGESVDKPWFALRDQLRANPKNTRIVAAGPVLAAPDGFVKEVSLEATSPEDAQAKVDQLIDAGADVIKIGLNSPILPEFSPDVVTAIAKAAHSRGRPVAAHVISAHGMGVAVEAGVDDINHLAPIGDKSEALIRQAVAARIYWIPTLEPGLAPPKERPSAQEQATPRQKPSRREKAMDSFKYFLKLGGLVALGNDSGSMPDVQVGMPIKEILSMRQEAGMTPMQIIEAATRHAARVCKLEKEIGTLEPGKLADLLVVEGNPLEDLNVLTNARLVIHNGVVIREEKECP